MKFIIVFDNEAKNRKLSKGWGISVFFPEIHLLMDTGESPVYLEENFDILGIKKEDIGYVFITHEHWDHIGGIDAVKGDKRTVFVPKGFTDDTLEMLNAMDFNVKVISEPGEILPDIYSSGPLGDVIKEQNLIVETQNGLSIFTGCSHPGLNNILENSKRFGTLVFQVTGGFHLLDKNKRQIEEVINTFKKYRVKKVAPMHCTGDLGKEMFKETYGDDYIDLGVGSEGEV